MGCNNDCKNCPYGNCGQQEDNEQNTETEQEE